MTGSGFIRHFVSGPHGGLPARPSATSSDWPAEPVPGPAASA
jgi:hypothetical protein